MAVGAGLLVAPAIGRTQTLDGRRISFLIGNEGSGGYEAYARLFAKHLALALPNARLTVEVIPAADGRRHQQPRANRHEGTARQKAKFSSL